MNTSTAATSKVAQLYEVFLQRSAYAFLVLGVLMIVDVGEALAGQDMQDLLRPFEFVLVAVILVLLVPALHNLRKARNMDLSTCRKKDSFALEVYRESTMRTFTVVFLCLVAFKAMPETWQDFLPPEHFVNVILAIACLFFALNFFALGRGIRDADHDATPCS